MNVIYETWVAWMNITYATNETSLMQHSKCNSHAHAHEWVNVAYAHAMQVQNASLTPRVLQFASMVTMEWFWIHGSTVMDLEPPTDPRTALSAKSSHVLPSQPPLGANQDPTIERRWNQGLASTLPMPPGTPIPLHCLSFGHMQGNTLCSNPMR
jgi:hypothetical protein